MSFFESSITNEIITSLKGVICFTYKINNFEQ